jgi:hypothetical protein
MDSPDNILGYYSEHCHLLLFHHAPNKEEMSVKESRLTRHVHRHDGFFVCPASRKNLEIVLYFIEKIFYILK